MNVFDFLHVDAWSALLLVTALKGAIILVCALLATRMMTKASAATRHAVWVLAFLTVLVMPALLVAVPGWQVPVLPGSGFTLGLDEEVALAMPAVRSQNAIVGLSGASAASVEAASRTLKLGTLFLLFWGLGAFFVAARWLAGILSAWVLTRRAIRVDDPQWAKDVDRVRATLGLKRSVSLRISAHTRTPMTWGVLYPVVLLPEGAIRWSTDRRTVVLMHELAHVCRFDSLTQWIAQTACVLHWFNPFVWKSYQRFLVEREHACDDYVLTEGTRASSYAEHLLDIAKGIHNQQRAELAMAPMAQKTQIEERLRSILNDQQRRDRLSRRLLIVVCTLVLALVWPVTAITFVARDQQYLFTHDVPAPEPPRAPEAPFPPAPPFPPEAPLPPVSPAPPSAEPTPEPYPEPAPRAFFEPVGEVMSGPASTGSNLRFVVRREVTDEQRRQKRSRDDQFDARLDASLAAEMENLGRAIQIDVERIVADVENDRWDGLEERARSVVQHVAVIVAEAEEWGDTQWDGHSSTALAAMDEDARNAAVAVASERKRRVQESAQRARPSAHPSRINNNSNTCKNSNNEN